MVKMISRNELWRRQYLKNRYMRSLTDEDLKQRAKDIFINHYGLNRECLVTIRVPFDNREFWFSRGAHLLEEFSKRFGQYPAGFDTGSMKHLAFPDPRNPMAARAVTSVKGFPNLKKGSFLVKYGNFPTGQNGE